MILKGLLVRPITIEPRQLTHYYSDEYGTTIDEEVFYYEWSGNPLRRKATGDLSSNSTMPQDVHISWQTNPTEQQLEMIKHHKFDEQWKYDEFSNTHTQQVVLRRGEFPSMILNHANIQFHGVQANILHVCKGPHEQGSRILYSKNTFVFDNSRVYSDTQSGGREHEDFRDLWHLHSSIAPNGSIQVHEDAQRFREIIYNQRGNYRKFMDLDLLPRFLETIGCANVSFVSKIIIKGAFCTGEEMDFEDRPHHTPAIGWGRILRVHTAILANSCGNLNELVLH